MVHAADDCPPSCQGERSLSGLNLIRLPGRRTAPNITFAQLCPMGQTGHRAKASPEVDVLNCGYSVFVPGA